MGRVLDKLNIDINEIKEIDKTIEEKVADILIKATKRCEKIVMEAQAEANEIIGGYGAEVVISNETRYNISEKVLKLNKMKQS